MKMNLLELVAKVRRYTRDLTGSLFTSEDVEDFCNEGIHRLRNIPELRNMVELHSPTDEVNLLPNQYHYFIALYGASRCFTQDEQHAIAQQFMNEYEFKTQELDLLINDGDLVIEGAENVGGEFDHVKNVYFLEDDR